MRVSRVGVEESGRRSCMCKAVRQERKGVCEALYGAGPVRRQGSRALQDVSMIWV